MASTRKRDTYDQVMDRRLVRLERRLGNVQATIEELQSYATTLLQDVASNPRPALRVVKGGQ